MTRVFKSWLEVHIKDRETWQRVVRFKFKLERLKFKRMVQAWRIRVRLMKIQRLRITILTHKHFKLQRKACFDALRDVVTR
jgi:hypothetical protein